MMRRLAIAIALMPFVCSAQNSRDVLKQGEQVFAQTCATGYCHGVRGGASGAPRLAARGFDQPYIAGVVTQGIAGSGMPAFATRLSRADLLAVVAYVASLNGIANPNIGGSGAEAAAASAPALSGDAARGELLFRDAVRGFGRCSTCHEVGGLGTPVASPIANVPASVEMLRTLATPNVKTGVVSLSGVSESMPALVLSEGVQNTIFYDLTSAPPVERYAAPGSAKFTAGSNWRHSSAMGAYNDSELNAILAYLRAAIKP